MSTRLFLPVLRVLLAAVALALVSCSSGAYKYVGNHAVRPVDPFPSDHFNRVHHNHSNPT